MKNAIAQFNLAEKTGIVKLIDSVILADGEVHKGELHILQELMLRIDFHPNMILQARSIDKNQAIQLLQNMTEDKKNAMASILDEVAISDGFVHKRNGPDFKHAKIFRHEEK